MVAYKVNGRSLESLVWVTGSHWSCCNRTIGFLFRGISGGFFREIPFQNKTRAAGL